MQAGANLSSIAMPAPVQAYRFYGILDTAYVTPRQWSEKCRALLAGGADMVEMRAKRESPAERERLLDAIVPLFEGTDVPLIVNDFLELALRHPRLGLHLGQDDMPVDEARAALGPERILGLSTHSLEQARDAIAQAHALSYFCVGPVYATATKPEYAAVGLDLVRAVAALHPPLPFFAIGGVNTTTLDAVLAAGARRVCVVSEPLLAGDTAACVRALRQRVAAAVAPPA